MHVSIPFPLLVTVDDVGWWLGQDGSAAGQPFRTGMPRKHVPEDYAAIIVLGKALNMKIPAGFILCEWDDAGLLRDVPSATWLGEDWVSPFADREVVESTAEIIRDGNRYLEVAIHGLAHEFWEQGIMQRSEFHDQQGRMRSEGVVRKHLEYFFKLLDRFSLADTPRLFIPPALHHSFGEEERGFQAIARSFGLQYVTLVFSRAHCCIPPQFDGLGWEEGIMLLDRGIYEIKWNQVAPEPVFNFEHPILPLHWANILHPNPDRNMEVIQKWISFLMAQAKEKHRVFSRDIASCMTQYLHATQSRIVVEQGKCTVTLDWINRVPRNSLADELFFAVSVPKGCHLMIQGAARRASRSSNEEQFIKLSLPDEDRITFEFLQE